MPDELRKLAGWLLESEWPAVSCPNCGLGFVAVEQVTTVNSAASDRARDDDDWEPEWIFGHFHGTLRCNRSACREPIIVSGAQKVDGIVDDRGRFFGEYGTYLRLRYAIPGLQVMAVPPATSKGAGNRLRVAIEDLLTDYGMRRYVNSKGKRTRLTTHARIQEFKKYESLAGETLEAVKWIGNQATHGQGLTVDDVLDGAGLFEYALKLHYDTSDDEVAKLVRKINKSKGLPRKHR